MRPTNSYTGTVYRGSNLLPEHLQPYLDAWATTSREIPIPPFQSTSTREIVADDFIARFSASDKTEVMFEIQSRTGVYIDDISDYGKNLQPTRHPDHLVQEEVILNKNGLYVIDDLIPVEDPDGTIVRYTIKMTEQ
jgi:hypothetical protein